MRGFGDGAGGGLRRHDRRERSRLNPCCGARHRAGVSSDLELLPDRRRPLAGLPFHQPGEQERERDPGHESAPTTCGRLSSSSKIAISVPLSQSEAGYRYRIRSEYVRPGVDVSDVNSGSAWQYLIIES